MVVQVATVWTLLDVAVLGEVLHPNPHVDHWLPAVLTVQAGLGGEHKMPWATVPLYLTALPTSNQRKRETALPGKLIKSLVKHPFITQNRVRRASDKHEIYTQIFTHQPDGLMTLLSRCAALLVITTTGGKKILNLYYLNFSGKVPLTIGNLCPLDFKKWLKPTSLIQICMKFLWRFFLFILKIHIHFSFYWLLHFCFLWGKNKISLKYSSKIEDPGIRATFTLRLLEPASTLYLYSCPSLPLTAQDPSFQQ